MDGMVWMGGWVVEDGWMDVQWKCILTTAGGKGEAGAERSWEKGGCAISNWTCFWGGNRRDVLVSGGVMDG